MVAPHLEDVIAASLPATHPPQHQHRHPDLLREVRTVLYEVDRRAGAVFVAGRADRLRVPEAAQVLVPRRRLDRVLVVQQGAEHMAQEALNQRVAGSSPAAPTQKSKAYDTIIKNHQIIIRTVSAKRSRADRYPLSPRIRVLQAILDRIEPAPVREPLPPSKAYAPPRAGRRRRG
jgi:hypothetical protein